MVSLRTLRNAAKVFMLPFQINPPFKHIVQIGDSVLRVRAIRVSMEDIKTEYIQKVLQVMLEIMSKGELIGVSAPQIGLPLQIIAFQCSDELLSKMFTKEQIEENDIKPIPPEIWINPEMKILDYDSCIDGEMCGSVLSLRADVKRYKSVSLSGMNATGSERKIDTKGFLARIIQHEMDHLNGVLFTDRMNPKTLRCDIWEDINRNNGYISLNFHPLETSI